MRQKRGQKNRIPPKEQELEGPFDSSSNSGQCLKQARESISGMRSEQFQKSNYRSPDRYTFGRRLNIRK